MKRLIAVALTLLLSFSLWACGNTAPSTESAAETAPQSATETATESAPQPAEATADAGTPYITLKWADHNNAGCPTTDAMDELAAQLEEATEGRVKIDIYHGAVLGSGPDALSLLETGVADMVWTSTAFFSGQFPYTEIMLLPMMGIKDSIIGTNILWDLLDTFPDAFAPEYADYHLLTAFCNPVTILGTDTEDIASLDDLKGLNIRTAAGPDTKAVEAWGASPVSVAPPDLYLAMQKGVVDGYLFAANGVSTWGLSELTNTMVDLHLGYAPGMVLVSNKAWESLTPEDQAIFDEIGGRTGGLMMAAYTEEESVQLSTLHMENGGTFKSLLPGDPLFEELKAPLSSIVSDWVASTSTDTFDSQKMIDLVEEKVNEY